MTEKQFEAVVVPAPNVIMGHFPQLVENSIDFISDLAAHGDYVKVRLANKWLHILYHPDLLHDFLIKKSKYFNKASLVKQTLHDITPMNVFVADGDYWKQQHQLMMPAFHSSRISAYADTMVDYTLQAASDWHTGTQVDMDQVMMSLTMRIITKTMFDLDLDMDVTQIGDTIEDIFAIMQERLAVPFVVPAWIPTQQNRKMAALGDKLYKIMDLAIQKWREAGEDTGDLLSMLMMATYDDGSKMDDTTLKRELIIIFGAGHETTAHTLSYTFYALASEPDIKAKLQAEIDTVLRGERATLESIGQLTYLDKVLKESMRLYTVAQFFAREANQDTDIMGVPVKAGELVFVPTWAIHRDARWYPDPLKFDPERFTPESEAARPKYAYIPFGGGPRVCIGNQFALLEARLVLATLMQKFDFALPPDYVMTPIPAFTTKPKGGVPLTITVREPMKPSAV